MDVAAWLHQLGLGQYVQAFRDNAVDGQILASLTPEDLKELGVVAVGHRRRLLDAIAALRAEAEAEAARAVRAEPVGERRQVTVLFADLVGYTALARELDAEETHALLDRFFARADRIVEEHGGLVDKHIGDCVMAVFGAPVAHGNDAERAVRAALAIRDAMPAVSAEAGRAVDVHVGVAGGQVVASGTGSTGHRAYTVTGQSVNLASRLTGAAQAGEVLVSDAVRRALGERLAGDELEPLEVKGFAEPVRAWRLRGLQAASGRGPLAGRTAELDRFREALADCRASGRGRTVHVRGEAGIGKTRLVEEFQREARAAGFACHAGLVLDFGSGTGRGAARALVLGMIGREPADGTDEAAAAAGETAGGQDAVLLNDLLGLPQPAELRPLHDAMDHATRAQGRRRVLGHLVERSSRVRPRLLVVEDLHWADRPTLAHLAALAAAVPRCPAILVATSRPEGDPLHPAWWAEAGCDPPLTLDLGPLDPAAARLLAQPFLAANATFAERCVERAAGNPLFLEHLLRHAEEGLGNAVPGSVQSLVQARLDRLDPADREVLQAAAVLGQRFELEPLCHLLGRPDHGLERLAAHALVRSRGEGFLFAHALVREAVYDSLLRSRRRELHRRAAAWYDGHDAALRAEHLDRADDPGAACAYLAAALAQAAEHRHELALRLAERGLERAGGEADRFALGCLRGDVLHDLGQMPAALSAYEEALATASGEAEQCRALIGCAAVKRVTDDLAGAFADLARAEAVASGLGLAAEAARIHFLRGNLCFPRGDIEGCLREHRRSLELARAAGAAEQEAAALGGLGDAEYVRGRMISAHDAFRGCVELCRERGLGRIEVANRPMMALARWFAGDTRAALDEALTSIAAAARVGQLRAEMIAHHAAYFCHHSLTAWPEAWDHAERSLLLARQLGARRFEAEALAFQAELHRVAGRRSEALADVGQALAISRETGMAFLGPVILGVLALATADEAVLGAALAEADGLLTPGAIGHNHLLFRRDAIEACLHAGAWDGADRHAAALADYARREPSPWTGFVVARGRALTAHGRGESGPGLAARLVHLQKEAERLGHLDAMPALEAALNVLPTANGSEPKPTPRPEGWHGAS